VDRAKQDRLLGEKGAAQQGTQMMGARLVLQEKNNFISSSVSLCAVLPK
jgi:hypothetical protein